MGSFVKLEWLDPYELFASKLDLSRRPMALSFNEAFAAFRRCHSILHDLQWADFNCEEGWLTEGDAEAAQTQLDPGALQYQAQVEDNSADWQASVVLLFADDALQSLARGVLRDHKSLDGYGPEYLDVTNSGRPVRLTTLLRAGTTAIRHVSDWDTPEMPFPYRRPEEADERWQQALQNIDVINRAFGIGTSGRIRDFVSMRVLIRVDGTLGDKDTEPSYARFERAMIEAATDIARKANGAERLERSLRQLVAAVDPRNNDP